MVVGLAPLSAAEILIDDFDAGIEGYTPTLQYGQVDQCRASRGEGINGSGALRVDFELEGGEINHILFVREVDLDLSWCERLSFEVKGDGDQALVFLFLYDSQDRFNNYGPHGSNGDFHTGYPDWHCCEVVFDRDHSTQGGNVDLSDVKRVGFFIWGMGPKKGTAWFDNLVATEADRPAALKVAPSVISPNGDGINDTATFITFAPRQSNLTVEVLDAAGQVVATPVRDEPQAHRKKAVTWPDPADLNALPDGDYTVRAKFTGPQSDELKEPMTLDTTHHWPPVQYANEPFFPIGVWFEGAPSMSGCPTEPVEAKKFYDRCFADLAAHGFNAAAVPNCPEPLWEPLLQSAQEQGVKICLEVGPLVALVSRTEPPSETEVYATVRQVVDRIGKYESLLRYQIRDEPPPELVPNWLLVQRILAAVDPQRPAFSCFCHPDSLAQVAASTTLSEGVFDIYPHWAGTPKPSLGNFLPSLDTFQAASKGNRMWAVLQAFAITHAPNSWRYPTPEELRAVTYLSLAAGVKGVFYFIYSHIPGYLDGMVAADGTPQPIYAPTSELAQELKKLSPLLLALQPVDPPAQVEGEVRVGSFRDGEGRPVLIVASTRPDAEVSARLRVPGAWEDALSGEVFQPEGGWLTVRLGPGAGRVLLEQKPYS